MLSSFSSMGLETFLAAWGSSSFCIVMDSMALDCTWGSSSFSIVMDRRKTKSSSRRAVGPRSYLIQAVSLNLSWWEETFYGNHPINVIYLD